MAESESKSNGVSKGASLLVGFAAGAAGSLLGYLASQRRTERALRDLRAELRAELANAIARVERAAEALEFPGEADLSNEVSEDIVLLITSAVTAYLGKNVRVRSVRKLQPSFEKVAPWAQQGRAYLQGSHNIAQRTR
jgi:hypothetical protein